MTGKSSLWMRGNWVGGGVGTGSEVLNRKKKMQLGYCEECISQTNAKSNNLFVKKLKSVISFYDSYQIFWQYRFQTAIIIRPFCTRWPIIGSFARKLRGSQKSSRIPNKKTRPKYKKFTFLLTITLSYWYEIKEF